MQFQAITKWFALLCSLLWASVSLAVTPTEPRFALIIGNGAYTAIGELPNPAADAQLISDTLEQLGFDTTLALDASQFEMKKAIADFGRTLRSSNKNAVGFFYYAGHGVQANGRNFLLPVEATPIDQADLDLMGVEANWVLRQMESAGNRTNIIVLDACRNNPFVAANRSLGRGLAQIDAPTGSFISYATAPGKVAMDGDGANSPFSTALARALPMPGMPIEQIFKQVRVDVIKETQGAQIPWDSSSLVEDFYISPAEQPVVETVAKSDYVTTEVEAQLWESIKGSGDADRISMFLQIYPTSPLAAEARSLLATSLISGTGRTAAEPAADIPKASTATENSRVVTTTTAAPVTVVAPQPVPEPAEAPPVGTAVSQDPAAEFELFDLAQSTQSRDAYLTYLDTYPQGIFVDLVRAEIAAMDAAATSASMTTTAISPSEPDSTRVAATPEAVEEKEVGPIVIRFDMPLATDNVSVGGPRSIQQLIKGSPLYAPIEGLDPSYWELQTCSNCHSWDKTSLCTQGSFYSGVDESALVRLKHPYGGFFKSALREWAAQGCN